MQIALFHSVLGLRPGITDAAARLRDAGHEVTVVDQYGGQVFDDYEEADAFASDVGYPALMEAALAAVTDVPDGFVAMGFSNGGGMAEHVAAHRTTAGVVMLSGALPPAMLGLEGWPDRLPAQIHYAVDDPFRNEEWLEQTVAAIRAADAPVELFDDYSGNGHLFTDPSLPDEHDPQATEVLWERVLAFCSRLEE